MTGITHAAAGAALGASLGVLGSVEVSGAVVGAVAALLPDIDHPGSIAGRVMRPVAVWLEERYGHRDSPTHTLLFCIPVGLMIGLITASWTGSFVLLLCGMMGALSHLLLDSMTRSGLQPLKLYLPGPPKLTGRSSRVVKSLAEKWSQWKESLENSTWAQKRWSGPIYTGKDPREFALAVFCIVIIALIIGI